MQVSENFNQAVVDALAVRFEETIFGDPNLTQREALAACMTAIGNILESINCRDCRNLTADFVKKSMPRIIATAVTKVIAQNDDHHH
jgi:hypothetical protein